MRLEAEKKSCDDRGYFSPRDDTNRIREVRESNPFQAAIDDEPGARDAFLERFMETIRSAATKVKSTRHRRDLQWQELLGEVWCGLFGNDARALRAFRGDCDPKTFIYRVAHNVAHRAVNKIPKPNQLVIWPGEKKDKDVEPVGTWGDVAKKTAQEQPTRWVVGGRSKSGNLAVREEAKASPTGAIEAHGPGADGAAVADERRRLVRDMLAGMGVAQRQVLVMFYQKGMSHREIAAARGCSVKTSQNLLNRAIAYLRSRKTFFRPEDLI